MKKFSSASLDEGQRGATAPLRVKSVVASDVDKSDEGDVVRHFGFAQCIASQSKLDYRVVETHQPTDEGTGEQSRLLINDQSQIILSSSVGLTVCEANKVLMILGLVSQPKLRRLDFLALI